MFCCGGKKEEAPKDNNPPPSSSPPASNEKSLSPPPEAAAAAAAPPPQQPKQEEPPPKAEEKKPEEKQEEKKPEENKPEEKSEEKKKDPPASPGRAAGRQNKKQRQQEQKEEKAAAVLDMLFCANDRSMGSKWVQTADQSATPKNDAGSESENSDSESVSMRKSPLAILDVDLKQSGLRFSPMRFSPQEKILLRDNMSSVKKKDIQPKFNRLSHDHIKLGAYLGAAVRLVYKDHAYKIKRISYDRPLLHNGLLYFIDAHERDGKGSFHIWLLIRLVVVADDSAKIENPEPVMTINKKTKKEEPRPLLVVHDMFCKDCRQGRDCDHKFKASQRITDYTFGLYIKFPVKLEGNLYLYGITLNSPMQAALSSRVFLSAQAKKDADRARKEKQRDGKGKEMYEEDGDGEGSDSSSAQSFSEVPTEHTGAVDLAQDYMDEDSFFERSYMSFRKAEPSQKGERRRAGMLDRTSDAGSQSDVDDYYEDTDEGIEDDPDHEYDPPDDEEAYEDVYGDVEGKEKTGGESSDGAGALDVLAQLRGGAQA